MGSLRLTRPYWLLVDRWHRYTVMIDGERVGRIANGETVEITVSTGNHTLKVASIIFLASRGCGEVAFTMHARETLEFTARARIPGLERFAWLHPNEWIEVKRVEIRSLT